MTAREHLDCATCMCGKRAPAGGRAASEPPHTSFKALVREAQAGDRSGKATLNVRLAPALIRQLTHISKIRGMTVSEMTRTWIEANVDQEVRRLFAESVAASYDAIREQEGKFMDAFAASRADTNVTRRKQRRRRRAEPNIDENEREGQNDG